MADEGKRSETICFKATERMALDLLRLAALQDRTMSDFLYTAMRQKLYGDMVRLEQASAPSITSDKVNL